MCRSLDDPAPTLTAGGTHLSLIEPFIMGMSHSGSNGDRLRTAERPLNTVTTADDTGLVQPFILPPEGIHRGNAPRDPADPLQTVTAGRGGGHLVQPFLVPTFNGEREGQSPRTHSVEAPLPTVVACRPTHAVVEPFLLPHRQFDRMDVDSVGVPLRTITAADRLGLVQPDGTRLDIRFRMLQPHELAAAMGFPACYKLTGNRADQVRQVGNAVEVNVADALASAILEAC